MACRSPGRPDARGPDDRPHPRRGRPRKRGRNEFNARERSILEFARYRCFLLGLHEELLHTTKGLIVTPHTLRFRSHLKSERSREWRVLQWVAGGAVLAFAVGLFFALQASTSVAVSQAEGYGERICSALIVAFLTTAVILLLEYRDRGNVQTEVQWLLG